MIALLLKTNAATVNGKHSWCLPEPVTAKPNGSCRCVLIVPPKTNCQTMPWAVPTIILILGLGWVVDFLQTSTKATTINLQKHMISYDLFFSVGLLLTPHQTHPHSQLPNTCCQNHRDLPLQRLALQPAWQDHGPKWSCVWRHAYQFPLWQCSASVNPIDPQLSVSKENDIRVGMYHSINGFQVKGS